MKAILGNKILTRSGVAPGCIIMDDGVIKDVFAKLPKSFTGTAEDMGDLLVMPGIVDSHVHINEPGHTSWEGLSTATRAGAAGGVTTIVDMPLHSIPATLTSKALEEKIKCAREKIWIDVGFWGGVSGDRLEDLPELLKSGVLGVCAFLMDVGVSDFKFLEEDVLEKAFALVGAAKVPFLFHGEINKSIGPSFQKVTGEYKTYLQANPRKWENDAVDLLIHLAGELKCKVHLLHLSSSDRLPELQKARRNGVSITVETCPHYLTISSDGITAGKTLYKCRPPIREESNKELLWDGLKQRTIDFVASDHDPCDPALKCIETGDMEMARPGISSLQLSLPLIWTEARKRKIGVELVSDWMSSRPSEFIGFRKRKGEIAKGYDGDLVVWDPEASFKVSRGHLYHKHTETPYLGRTLFGVIHKTFVRGHKVFDRGRFSSRAMGEILLKEKKKWKF